MPTKPIIEIEVDDSKFQQFLQAFESYKKSLDDMSGAWRAIGADTEHAGEALDDHVATVEALNEAFRHVVASSRHAGRLWTDGAHAFKTMAHHAKDLGASIEKTMKLFLPFSGLGGLIGIGGLAGAAVAVAELARTASSLRRETMQLGVPARALQFLQPVFGNVIGDVAGPLTAIAEAQQDLSKRWAFMALGEPKAMAEPPTAAYLDIVRGIREAEKRVPASIWLSTPWAQAAATLGFSPEQQRAIRNLQPGELAGLMQQYLQNVAKAQKLSDADKKWQDFTLTIDTAKKSIENTFIHGLAPLAPGLSALTNSLARATNAAINFAASFITKHPVETGMATGGIAGMSVGGAVGAVTGGIVGFAIGGPPGALAGAGIGAEIGGGVGLNAGMIGGAAAGHKIQEHILPPPGGNEAGRVIPLPPPGSTGRQSSLSQRIRAMASPTGSVGRQSSLDQRIQAMTPPTGSVAQQIIKEAKAQGASNAAITALIAAAMGEGGVWQPWKPGDKRNGQYTSFGPWQLHKGAELDRFLAAGGQPGDVRQQTAFVLRRLNEMFPGFSKLTDLNIAIADVAAFENSVRGVDYYRAYLPAAERFAAQLKQELAARAPAATAKKHDQAPTLVAGGAIKKALHPLAARAQPQNNTKVTVENRTGGSAIITVANLAY